ncbi:MAG: flagellar export chaperone FlgN [Lachnospiraceae bacterium]|nr:flagellar export chaperone FlgN [Lachnospiraceae bacterium]
MAENSNYLTIMAESLSKKIEILEQLLEYTRGQETLLEEEEFRMEEFQELLDKKGELIDVLNTMDQGFEQVYERIEEEIQGKKEAYASEIVLMQQRIKTITDLSVKLQELEYKNKEKIEVHFLKKRNEIKTFRQSKDNVNKYYRAMSKTQVVDSAFLDKKN